MRRVNMKTLMFGALGLTISMVLTTMWVGHDMAQIRARQARERAARCAGQQSQSTPAPSVDPTTGMPAPVDAPAATTSSSTTNTCATMGTQQATTGTAAGVEPSPDPSLGSTGAGTTGSQDPAVDPNLAPVDPNLATGVEAPVDPGLPVDSTVPVDTAGGTVVDPTQPTVDPNAVPVAGM